MNAYRADDPPPGAVPLQGAAIRVLERMRGVPFVAPDEQVLGREMELLAGAVRAALQSGSPSALPTPRGDRLALLRALRSEVVRGWPDDLPLRPMMEAIEKVQEAVLGGGDEGASAYAVDPHARQIVREVAHMLRSPLGSIVMMAETMRELGDDLSVEARSTQLAIIHRAALTVATVAGDLLTLVGTDDIGGVPVAFTLPETLTTVADIVRPVTEAHSCVLEVHAPDPRRWVGPAGALARAVLGLTLGAAHRTHGGVVHLSAESGDDNVAHFEVTGRGPGAAPDDGMRELRRLFRIDPDGASYTVSSEGMGVLASERLVRGLGADLVIETPEPDELRLAFSLPLSPAG